MRYAAFLIAILAGTSGAAWLQPWQFRSEIECDADLIVGGAKTNFPLLVILNQDHADIFDNALPNGDDIRFTKAGGDTLLTFEKVSYDPVSQHAEFWVLIPAFGDARNILYLYYGNALATGASAPNTVWADYELVLHYDTSPTIGGPADSSPNNHNINLRTAGTGGWNATNLIGVGYGKIGRSWLYVKGVTTSTREINASAHQWTVQAWVKLFEHGTDFIIQGNPGGNFWHIDAQRSDDSHDMGYETDGGGGPSGDTTDFAFHDGLVQRGVWHRMVWQMVASGDSVLTYLDTTADATAAEFPTNNIVNRHGIGGGSEPWGIGSTMYPQSNGPDSMDGILDELRIRMGTPPDANWLTTEYNNQNAPADFYTIGERETTTCE